MFSTLCDIVNNIAKFFSNLTTMIGGLDALFFIALAVEVFIVIFFLVKSMFSYEASLNRSINKLNMWLFEKKTVTEENIKELNMLFKMKGPKRLCYYWQQYILFREGNPSTYLSSENLVEKPLKTSSYNSNIKNLSMFSTLWAFIVAMFVLVAACFGKYLEGTHLILAILVPIIVEIIAIIFVVFLRSRKNATLNALYQNVQLFGRFMDNACVDLPSYIDYQILFTVQEIENGQPVLREFLDYKARTEKEAFNKAKEEDYKHETFDFSSAGVDGSLVLDRAMKESETFLKKKEKILLGISTLEAELDSRKKNFDTVQKDYQTKIQASKENVDRLRQMQEETTNRIESNYYRKQQTQEIAKQETYEQEFEQQRAKYLLEKKECEDEIAKLNNDLENYKADAENAMKSEYQTFFDKFCKSAEKVVTKSFGDKWTTLKTENEAYKQRITELEIKLKSVPQGEFDAAMQEIQSVQEASEANEGHYDENGNYVYANGTFYDAEGNFHDQNGNVYSQDGILISAAAVQQPEPVEEKPEEKSIVDFDSFDAFDFMTDTTQKADIYGVAENVIKEVDQGETLEVVNNAEKTPIVDMEDFSFDDEPKAEEKHVKQEDDVVDFDFDEISGHEVEETVEETPKRKAGRPRKIVKEEEIAQPAKKRGRPRKEVPAVVEEAPKRKAGRPRKIVETPVEPKKKVGRPKKAVAAAPEPEKKKVGRPKKIIKDEPVAEKKGRGRPKKNDSIEEINKKLADEEKKLKKMRNSLSKDLEDAVTEIESVSKSKDAKRQKMIAEIDKLQKEAEQVMGESGSEKKLTEINSKLENLLKEIKKLNA